MRCQRCGEREAIVRVKLPQESETDEKFLCSVCVRELAREYQGTACPSCGMTRQQLLHLRKVGCPTCYSFLKTKSTAWFVSSNTVIRNIMAHGLMRNPLKND